MRLLSYNIHKGIGGRDRRYRPERIVEVIQTNEPDIICMQEVDQGVNRSRYHDQPAWFADELGMPHVLYQRTVRIKQGGYGNLILSRFPLLTWRHVSLRVKALKARGGQLVDILTPQGTLHLVHWHLGLAERERRWQVRHLLQHSFFRDAEELPTLCVGDTNDWRNQLHRRCFAHAGFRHVTTPIRDFRSFPAWLPMGSLDKAFTRGPIRIENAMVDRRGLAKSASDHLPLILDFQIGLESESGSEANNV